MIERFFYFLENQGLKQTPIEKELGLSNGYLGKMRQRKASVGSDVVQKIVSRFPEINVEWLLTGNGSMLKINNPLLGVFPYIHDDSFREESPYMVVEYVDLRASSGKLGCSDISELADTRKRLVPVEHKGGNYLVVRVDGNSMDDGSKRSLSDGDEILLREIDLNFIDKLPIKKSLFAITTREGNVVKEIKEVNRVAGYLVCHSFNPVYTDFKILIEDIIQLFIVDSITQKQVSLV